MSSKEKYRGIIFYNNLLNLLKSISLDDLRYYYLCFIFREAIPGDRRITSDYQIDRGYYFQSYWIQKERSKPRSYYEVHFFGYVVHICLTELFNYEELRKIFKEINVTTLRQVMKEFIQVEFTDLIINKRYTRYDRNVKKIRLTLNLFLIGE